MKIGQLIEGFTDNDIVTRFLYRLFDEAVVIILKKNIFEDL